jgi:hypothetical protein
VTDTDTDRGRRWWDRLAGEELKARLVQRGVGLTSAGALVRDRDKTYATGIIDRHLGPR